MTDNKILNDSELENISGGLISDDKGNKVSKVEPKKTIHQIALEVIDGKWGNGQDRVIRLANAGYNANAVQEEVNRILGFSK